MSKLLDDGIVKDMPVCLNGTIFKGTVQGADFQKDTVDVLVTVDASLVEKNDG